MYSGVPLLFTGAQEELLNIPRRDVLHFHYEVEQPTLSQQNQKLNSASFNKQKNGSMIGSTYKAYYDRPESSRHSRSRTVGM